jgi:hypothetical protein
LIAKRSPEFIDFNVPSAPRVNVFINVAETVRRLKLCWLGHHIPVADVRWIASLLAQLSPEQIRDAFRAANYSPGQVETYSRVLEQRIAALGQL